MECEVSFGQNMEEAYQNFFQFLPNCVSVHEVCWYAMCHKVQDYSTRVLKFKI